MSLTPAQLDALNAIIGQQADALSIMGSARESTITLRNELMEDVEEPPVEPPPIDHAAYPATSDWSNPITRAAKVAWIKFHAGAGLQGPLREVASAADLAAYGLPGAWANGNWNLPVGGPFEHLDVKGLIYYSGTTPLQLNDVACQGIQYKSGSASQQGLFVSTTVRAKAGMALGQGGINFFGQSNWVISRCDIAGFADGIQCVGPGVVEESWFHDFAFGPTTHNDGIQHYGPGNVDVTKTVFELGLDPVKMNNHSNGALFCSNPSARFTASELYVLTLPISQANVNALNAYQAPKDSIIVTSGYIEGGHLASQQQGAIKLMSDVTRV